MTSGLYDFLKECSGKITADGRLLGTGFFVAPGQVLTCAHVVENFRQYPQKFRIHTRNREIKVEEIIEFLAKPYPDLALLRIENTDHSCVYLDEEFDPRHELFTYGHTVTYPEGDAGLFVIEGERQTEEQVFIKFKDAQVVGGFSGSPLLNINTGYVCGMTKSTRMDTLGGNAIPVQVIFKCIPELRQRNLDFHRSDRRWQELRSIHLGEILQPPAPAPPTYTADAARCKSADHLKKWKVEYFVGRTEQLDQVSRFLEQGRSVAIAGLPGIGKTALAAEIARLRLQSGSGDVLWLEARDAPAEVLMEALADELGDHQPVSASHVEDRWINLSNLLKENKIDLVVLDNAFLPEVVEVLRTAIPAGTRLLVTSEQVIACLDELIKLRKLSREEALDLLAYSAKKPTLVHDPGSAHLVQLLGYHPYAVFIAGRRLIVQPALTSEILFQRLKKAPHKIYLKELGKPSVEALLKDCIDQLDDESQSVLLSFGVLAFPKASLDLLAIYLQQQPEQLVDRLDGLVLHSLVDQPGANTYTLHDILFSYLKSWIAESQPQPAALASILLLYLTRHAKDYDLLRVDIDNLLAASGETDPQTLIQSVSWLVIGGYPLPQVDPYFTTYGHSIAMLERLDQAIAAARLMTNEVKPTLHFLLGKRGDAHFDRGEYSQAVEAYKESLLLTKSLETEDILTRFVKLSALTGKAISLKGERELANLYYRQAYRDARRSRDADLVTYVLEQQIQAAGETQSYQRAHQLAEILMRLNERLLEDQPENPDRQTSYFYSLLNLGSATLDLAKLHDGKFDQALAIHLKGKEVATQLTGEDCIALIYAALGEDYHYLGRRDEAQQYFHRAVPMLLRLGENRNANKHKRFLSEHGYSPAPEEDESRGG